MENPEILLLDEPMNGLDKHGVEEMRELFKKLVNEGQNNYYGKSQCRGY